MGVAIWGMSGAEPVVLGGQSGGGGGFTPASLTGLQLWLKADTGVYSDLGSTPATNGGSVEQWNDQSGNANNITQTTSFNRPVYTTGSINGLPTVGCVTSHGSVLNLSSTIALTGPFTLYVIGSRSGSTIWPPLGLSSSGSTTCVIYLDDKLYFVVDSLGNVNAAVTVSGAFAVRIRRDGSDVVKVAYTGTVEFTLGTISGTTTVGQVLGSTGSSQFGDNSDLFGEIVLCNTATSGADDTSMSTYFSSRWGLALP